VNVVGATDVGVSTIGVRVGTVLLEGVAASDPDVLPDVNPAGGVAADLPPPQPVTRAALHSTTGARRRREGIGLHMTCL
jgi:hypothetical protein